VFYCDCHCNNPTVSHRLFIDGCKGKSPSNMYTVTGYLISCEGGKKCIKVYGDYVIKLWYSRGINELILMLQWLLLQIYDLGNRVNWTPSIYIYFVLILPASSQQNLYDIYHCCVYSTRLLMMDRETVWNM